MTKDKWIVHDSIKELHKWVTFLAQPVSLILFASLYTMAAYFFTTNLLNMCILWRSKPVATSLDLWTLPSFEKEHGSLVEDFLCAMVHQAPSVSRPKVQGLLREHFKYIKYLKDLLGTCQSSLFAIHCNALELKGFLSMLHL